MFKKFLVLLVVATLVIPSAALAAGKPDSVENQGNIEQNTYKKNKTERSNYEKNTRTREANTKVTQSEEGDVDGDDPANAKGRTEEMRLRAQQEREEAKQVREEAKQKAKEDAKRAHGDQMVDEPEGSDEDSSTPAKQKGGGVLKAMEKIVAKITSWEEMGKAPGNALNALKTVVNKFASWFGLELPYQGIDAPGVSDEPGSEESTPSSDETTSTPSLDETDTRDPVLEEEQNDGSGEQDQISE